MDPMKKTTNKKTKPSLKERFDYWFDRHTSKGSLGLIRALIFLFMILVP